MKKISLCLFLILAMLVAESTWAQGAASSEGTTSSSGSASRSPLAVDPRTRALWTMADAPVRESKEVLLKAFEHGKLPLDSAGLPLLKRLAGAGAFYIDGTPGSLIDIRIRALSVLGTAGPAGAEAITELLTEESDPNAMAVAFYALGTAGSADDPRLIIMSRAIRRDALSLRSSTAGQFYLEAMQKLVPAGSDSKGAMYALEVMGLMTSVGYADHVRKQTIETIHALVGLS